MAAAAARRMAATPVALTTAIVGAVATLAYGLHRVVLSGAGVDRALLSALQPLDGTAADRATLSAVLTTDAAAVCRDWAAYALTLCDRLGAMTAGCYLALLLLAVSAALDRRRDGAAATIGAADGAADAVAPRRGDSSPRELAANVLALAAALALVGPLVWAAHYAASVLPYVWARAAAQGLVTACANTPAEAAAGNAAYRVLLACDAVVFAVLPVVAGLHRLYVALAARCCQQRWR